MTLADRIPRTDPVASPLLLLARGLVKSYAKGLAPAVAGVDLMIPERAFTTLLGPSGCGKTTILRLIAGFEQPDSGALSLDGVSLIGVAPEKRPVNTVFQSYALFPHLTVAENVGFSLTLRRGEINVVKRVQRALDSVHMADFGARYPHQLSGGQQQRVAVARAIIAEPRLLLLDEPLSALDRKMRAHLQIELKDLQRRLGIAFIYVTHDQEEAFALSDLVIVMNKGRIVQTADPRTIHDRPADAFVADFIGGSTLIEGQIVATSAPDRCATIETPFGLVAAPCDDAHPPQTGARAVLVIRPEAVRPLPDAQADSGAIRAIVNQTVYQGDRTMVSAEAAGLMLRYVAERAPAIGSHVTLALDRRRLFITHVAS